jgi:CHASE3 domain sensor protein
MRRTLLQAKGEFSLIANHKTVASLAGAALLVALVAVLSFWAVSQIESVSTARKQTYSSIIRVNALLNDLADAETAQRGYSLTGNESSLEPYLAVRDRIGGQLNELRPLASSSAARNHLDAMASLAARASG